MDFKKDASLRQKDESLRQKDESLRRKDGALRRKDARLRQKDSVLKQKIANDHENHSTESQKVSKERVAGIQGVSADASLHKKETQLQLFESRVLLLVSTVHLRTYSESLQISTYWY
ncbi:MAG: hypothetical protein ABJP45_04280 [Cyclobacteriaceae bacterium]